MFNDVDIEEVTAVADVVEIDCAHWLWASHDVPDGVDVPHWLINQEGENE